MAHPGKETPAGIVQMYERGMSLTQISKKTGCRIKFLSERLHALGVKLRPSGGKQNGRLAAIKRAHENLRRRQKRMADG